MFRQPHSSSTVAPRPRGPRSVRVVASGAIAALSLLAAGITPSPAFAACAAEADCSTVTPAAQNVALSTPATITVTLLGPSNIPIPLKMVTLSKIAGVGSPTISDLSTTPAPGETNAQGQVTFNVQSGTGGTDTFQAVDTSNSVTIAQTAQITFGPVSDTLSTVSASSNQVPADGATASTITVTLFDGSGSPGNPVSGKTVQLSKIAGAPTPNISAPAVTSSSGVATFHVTAPSNGTVTFQATDTTDSVVIKQTVDVTFGPVSQTASTVAANPTSVPANGLTTSTITVTLKTQGGAAVPGKAVTLAKISGPGTPTITGPSPATTDPNGQTTFTVSSPTLGSDAFQATDSTDGIAITPTATVSFTTGPVSAADSSVSASPTSVLADNSTPSTITVTLVDSGLNPVSGKTVTLARSSGPGAPVISAASGPSDANGRVTFTVKSATVGTDTFQATDSTDSVVITQTANVTFTNGPADATNSTVVASPITVAADGAATSTITVTLIDAQNHPVPNKSVSLARSAGRGTPSISAPSGLSDSGGHVMFTVSSTTPGTDTFQATDTTDSVVVTQTANVTFGPVSDTRSTLVASPTSVPADGATPSQLTVTLKDASGTAVAGQNVALAKTAGPGTPAISAGGATDVNGQFVFNVTSTTTGVDTFQATDTSDAGMPIAQTANVTFTAGAANPANSAVSASPTTVPADGSTTSTVTVTLKDVHGNVVPGKAVSLAKTSGPGTPAITGPTPATTDGNGQTTFAVSSTTLGTDVFTATDTTDGVAVTQTASVTFVLGPVSASQSTVVASPTSVVADGTTTSTVTVTLKDAQGHVVPGKAVSLSHSAGAGSPTITGPSPATTDANGRTTFTVASTTAATDTFLATDTTDSIGITQTASVTFTPGPVSASQSTATAAPATVPADGSATSTITVTLKDANGNPVSGKAVSLSKTAGPGTPTIAGPAPAATGSGGQTTFTVRSTTLGTDTFQATDTTDGVVVTQTASVTFSSGAVSASQSTVAASPTSVPDDGTTTSTVTVTLKDAQGHPVSGRAVSLAQLPGMGTSTITGPSPALTDNNGRTTFTVASTSASSKSYQATDTTDSLVISQTASVTYTTGPTSAAQSTVVASPTSVPSDGTTTSTITVTLEDATGNPEAGKAVTLARTAGPGSPTITGPTPTSTGSNGQTTFTVRSTTAGTDTFTATDTTDSGLAITQTADVSFTPGAANAGNSLVSASPGSVPADGATASTITVTLEDVNHNGVPGQAVTLAKTSGPGTPTIAGPNPATTDGNGRTSFTVTSTTLGTDVFTATDSTAGTTVTQTASVAFVVGPVSSASSTAVASPTSVPADGVTTSTITVTLMDGTGHPVPGKTVSLATASGPGSPVIGGPSPALTDGNGQTTFTVASSTVGIDTFTATDSSDATTLAQQPSVTFTRPPLPGGKGPTSTQQYHLTGSDGSTWAPIDSANLFESVGPSNPTQTVLISGNADLWTATAGYNQDIGIFVSVDHGTPQLLAWKESGGYAGTFSPNAAYVQTVYGMATGHSYLFTLDWKTNKPAGPGVTIYAGAGQGPVYSPTSLFVEAFPPTIPPSLQASTLQYSLQGSNGSTWTPVDSAHLALTLSPAASGVAILGGNADLWTQNAGINQDLAIQVSVDGGAFSLVAWKESGGFAGTFSPNAAFVQATYAVTGGHTYAFRLAWKSNVNTTGTIMIGAGPISGQFSPTSLFGVVIPSAGAPYSSRSNVQYQLHGSDGVAWTPIDPNLDITYSPTTDSSVILGANADLWTQNAGYNQDLGIEMTVDGGTPTLLAWKESGGFAGTYSPNAAYVQVAQSTPARHIYRFSLVWKTNRSAPGVTIWAGAGGGTQISPTGLVMQQEG